jgi:prepilin-type N-terminal cleavage/methylation domain-containing protein
MNTIKKGFTLIELLIVIAILGVLAVVVLVAINPVQQLARTRDSGRMSSVTQIGHAFEAYMASHNGEYPTTLQDLIDTGDLSAVPGYVNNTLTADCTGGTPAGGENGWCYTVTGTDSAFAVWAALEGNANMDLCGAGDTTVYAVYSSNTGKTCIACDEVADADAFNDTACMN